MKMKMNGTGTILTVIGLILLGLLLVLIGQQILSKKEGQTTKEEQERTAVVEPPTAELPQLIQVQELLREARLRMYNSEQEEDFFRAKELLEEAEKLLEGLENENENEEEEDYRVLYWKGVIGLEMGNWFSIRNEARRAEESFASALEAAERSIALYDRFSDSHRLVGELLMRLIDFRGTLFAAAQGPRAREEIEKALSLDPGNADAHLARGLWFLFTPGIFGGNLEEAIRSFRQAAERATEDHSRFLAHLWLAKALAAQGEALQAQAHLAKALEIYPHSAWAKQELEKLEKSEKK